MSVMDCSNCWHCSGISQFLFPWSARCSHPKAKYSSMPADYEFITSCHGSRWESKFADARRATMEAKENPNEQ